MTLILNIFFLDCSESSSPKSHFCCSTENKCGEFEGDCDNDDHCKAGLKCGDNNCPRAFEDRSFDCCYDPDVYSRNEELPNDYLGNNYDCVEEWIGDGKCDERNYHPSMWCGPYDGGDCAPKIDLMGDGKCDEQNNFRKFQNFPFGSLEKEEAEGEFKTDKNGIPLDLNVTYDGGDCTCSSSEFTKA